MQSVQLAASEVWVTLIFGVIMYLFRNELKQKKVTKILMIVCIARLLSDAVFWAFDGVPGLFWGTLTRCSNGNVKKCAVGKHPKSEKHGNTAQFSEVERSGTQENCGGIGSGCRLRPHPLPVLRRRQSQRVARIDPNAVVVDKNIAENDRFDLFSR